MRPALSCKVFDNRCADYLGIWPDFDNAGGVSVVSAPPSFAFITEIELPEHNA
jgi:hypothetical protein